MISHYTDMYVYMYKLLGKKSMECITLLEKIKKLGGIFFFF
jgi:hypothetical protein